MKSVTSIILVLALLFFAINASLASDLSEYRKRGLKSSTCSPLIEAGIEAYDAESLSAALSFFQQALANGCKDGLVFFKLGIYYESKDDMARAKKYLQLAKKHLYSRYRGAATTKAIHEHLGRVLFTMGDSNGARKELTQAISSQGGNFTVYFLLGSIARQEDNDKQVIYNYSKALTYTPPAGTNLQEILITLLVEIGTAYYNLEQYDKSLATWNQILNKAPNHKIARQYKKNIQQKMTNRFRDQMQQQTFPQSY